MEDTMKYSIINFEKCFGKLEWYIHVQIVFQSIHTIFSFTLKALRQFQHIINTEKDESPRKRPFPSGITQANIISINRENKFIV